jgi:hypothetical protein
MALTLPPPTDTGLSGPVKVRIGHIFADGRARLRWISPNADNPRLIGVRLDSYGPPMGQVKLSKAASQALRREHKSVAKRVRELQEQSQRLHALVEGADAELESARRLLRQLEEAMGKAPQLPFASLDEELRGRQLREIAIQLLRSHRRVGTVIHYKQWFALLEDAGIRVGGKSPIATFLTQISSTPEVESIRPRSGLYRLKPA